MLATIWFAIFCFPLQGYNVTTKGYETIILYIVLYGREISPLAL
jgi:hypothetical protein